MFAILSAEPCLVNSGQSKLGFKMNVEMISLISTTEILTPAISNSFTFRQANKKTWILILVTLIPLRYTLQGG